MGNLAQSPIKWLTRIAPRGSNIKKTMKINSIYQVRIRRKWKSIGSSWIKIGKPVSVKAVIVKRRRRTVLVKQSEKVVRIGRNTKRSGENLLRVVMTIVVIEQIHQFVVIRIVLEMKVLGKKDVRSTTKRVVVRGKRKATEKETRIYQMKIEMLTNID